MQETRQETQSRLPAALSVVKCGLAVTLFPWGPIAPYAGQNPLSGLAAVTVVNLCFIKVNNMSVQYTVSQYIKALVNVDVKTIFKIQNLSTTNVFIIILSQKVQNQARYAW